MTQPDYKPGAPVPTPGKITVPPGTVVRRPRKGSQEGIDEITEAIDRVLADMDTGGIGGSLHGGGHVRPPEPHQRTEYGFTTEDAVRLRESAELLD